MRNICLLGASGSIGLSTIDILRTFKDKFTLRACSVNIRVDILRNILKEFPTCKYACACKDDLVLLKKEFPNVHFYNKEEGLIELIKFSSCDLIVNALVGFAGLIPTYYAISQNLDVALANKETLVAGGDLINEMLIKHPASHLYPIDSEHVAIAKCLKHKDVKDVSRLIITASGGSFRDLTRDELKGVSVEKALNHPTWKMGAKITIDSATMVNKGFEIIEAYHLFHFPYDRIDVLLHDESIIHSLIEMVDHSYVADIGPSDMRIPISFALFETNYQANDNLPYLDLSSISSLHFRKLDENRYPALKLAKRCLKEGGSLGCVMNAANEACNEAFRNHELEFIHIEEIIERVMNEHRIIDNPTLDDLIYVNQWAYNLAKKYIKELR